MLLAIVSSMSALGQKRTCRSETAMSALPPKADIAERDRHVRFVPKADIRRCGRDWRYSMTSLVPPCQDPRYRLKASRSGLSVCQLGGAGVCWINLWPK